MKRTLEALRRFRKYLTQNCRIALLAIGVSLSVGTVLYRSAG